MKKDNLREFVSANRDSFDDQQPGSDILDKLHARLNLGTVPEVPQSGMITFQYWWAAAILIIGIVYFAVFENNIKNPNTTAHKKEVKSKIPPVAAAKKTPGTVQQQQVLALTEEARKRPDEIIQTKVPVTPDIHRERKAPASSSPVTGWKESLKSESSSARLAAILKLGESGLLISDKDLHILFSTMNNDESSNVRLAVLDLLKKQQNLPMVEDFILKSVASQDDPVVKMELLSSLSSDEAIKIKKELVVLSQDPNSLDFVREQAYAVLFRSNINI